MELIKLKLILSHVLRNFIVQSQWTFVGGLNVKLSPVLVEDWQERGKTVGPILIKGLSFAKSEAVPWIEARIVKQIKNP